MERPTFLFLGELVASGTAAARPQADVTRLPLSRLEEDYLRQTKDPALAWYARHIAAGGIDVRPAVYDHVGLELGISAVTPVAGNRTRITVAGHQRPAEGLIQLAGVISSGGADPNGLHWATRIDATTLEVAGNYAGTYTFQSALVSAIGTRKLALETRDTVGSGGKSRVVASSGDFIADGFRPLQRLAVAGSAATIYNTRGDYVIESVTATTITLRDEGSGGFHQEVAETGSNLIIQGTARLYGGRADVYVNPLAGGKANGHTETLFAGEMHPSNRHGLEAGFFPAAVDDPAPSADFNSSPLVVAVPGGFGPIGARATDGTVLGVVGIEKIAGGTRVTLSGGHGWTGSEYVFVTMAPGLEELDGYQEVTVHDATTIDLAAEIAGELPDLTVEPYRNRHVGTVAERELVASSVTAVGSSTEIVTTTEHGLAAGQWITIGNLAASPSINGAHKVSEVVDVTTFRIAIPITSATDVADAWISSTRRWGPAWQPTSAVAGERPHNGGAYLEHAKEVLETAWRKLDESGDTAYLAGIVPCFGYNDDLGAPGAGGQIDRFWLHYANLIGEVRRFAAELETSLGFPRAHADPATIPVVAVSYAPDQTPNPADPAQTINGVPLANIWTIRAQTIRALDAAGGKVGLVDPYANGYALQTGGLYYTSPTTLALGADVYETWKRVDANDAAPIDGESRGVPVYFLAGQSQTTGTVQSSWLLLDADPLYNGEWMDPATGSVIPGKERRAYIWNHLTTRFEELAGTIGGAPGNVNTHPAVNSPNYGNFGPEISLILKLRERHPDGVYLVKLAQDSAALQVVPGLPTWDPDAGGLYELLLEAWGDARAWLAGQGLVPDVRGFFWDQGEGDTSVGYRDTYQAALTDFVARVREDFGTRVEAGTAALPFVVGRLMDHDRQTYDPAGVAAVRAAQDAVAASDPDVVSVDLDSCAIKTDDVHRSGRGTIWSGLLLGEGIEAAASYGYEQIEDLELKPPECASVETSESVAAEAAASSSGTPVSSGGAGSVSGGVTISAGDTLSAARQIVAACDAAILSGLEVLSYSVNGRTVTRRGLSEIQATRSYYAKIIRNTAGLRRSFATFD